jgi:hypothetical protein
VTIFLEKTFIFVSFREWIRSFHILLKGNLLFSFTLLWQSSVSVAVTGLRFLGQDAGIVEQDSMTYATVMFCHD